MEVDEYEKDNNEISNVEKVKEEPTEIEPFSKYEGYDDSRLAQIQDGKFHKLESTELVEFPTSAEKDTVESKPDLTDFWDTFHEENSKCTNYEKTKPEFKHFPDEVEIKNEIEDHNEISSDLLRDTDEFKTDTPKTEDGIDIIHGDVKPESFEEVSIKIEPSTSTELSTDGGIGLQHDAALKEGEMIVDNDSKKKSVCCIFCSKSFEQKYDLEQNVRIYPGEICENCSKSFSNESKEVTHTPKKLHQCELCLQSFSSKGSLNKHGKIHSGKRPYQCDICSKSFTRKCHLVDHERTHTGKKPFKCDSCSKFFARRTELMVHQRSHTGEKPFQCNTCLKSFTQKGHLLGHERTHTGEKPFKCNFCPKSVGRRTELVVHQRIHTGEKPFQCNLCSKSFSQSSNLLIHKRIHTGDRPFQCDLCAKSFDRSSLLLVHNKKTHATEKPIH